MAMRHHAIRTATTTAALLTTLLCHAATRPEMDVIWMDFDMKDIDEPKARGEGFYAAFFEAQFVEQSKETFDIPKHVRRLAGKPKPAANVNALGEAPDSSWFTNRHHIRKLTLDELARGPNRSGRPDLSRAIITKAKSAGVTLGLQLKDNKGDSYLVKFDKVKYPELQSGAEVIATKLFYAAGYNVPENYIAYLDATQIQIAKDVTVPDGGKGTRNFTRADLTNMLQHVARMPDGRYRVLASKILDGKPKGPFPQVGLRPDDPNDYIPHEHRRELRGLRVIASWLNHWDMKEENGLDMYVEENGRKFLRHYLIDFGSDLGGGNHPLEYFHGREYAFDVRNITKEILTLGLYRSAWEKTGSAVSPAVGIFSNKDFSPGNWKPSIPSVPFDNMTDDDAFWATRIILAFTEQELRRIIATAEYSNQKDSDYILATLLERRRMIAGHWLDKVSPITNVALEKSPQGLVLTFDDLRTHYGLTEKRAVSYTFQVKGSQYKSDKTVVHERRVPVNPAKFPAGAESPNKMKDIEIKIWTKGGGPATGPITIYLYGNDSSGLYRLGRISRT